MTRLFNTSDNLEKRRELRRVAPTPEHILWEYLRGRKLGMRFRRQFGIGPYVLDFYAPKAKLAIELDGNIHATEKQRTHDAIRDAWLSDTGVAVLRFPNDDVYLRIDTVIEEIKHALSQRTSY